MDLDLVEQYPPVLEYARRHGLCRDYSAEPPPIRTIRAPATNDFEADLGNVTKFLTNPADEFTKERLALNKEAAILLKGTVLAQDWVNEANNSPKIWKRARRLKQEVPILCTDNELDLQEFGSTETPKLARLRIPLEGINEENDEGFQWPAKYFDYPKACDARTRTEKLSVPKDVLLFLQDVMSDPLSPGELNSIKTTHLTYTRNPALQPITPPLLPLSPPLTPYIPSSPGNRLELFSESSNLPTELKALNESILGGDGLIPPVHTDASDDSMLLDGFASPPDFQEKLPSPIMKRKREELRVEGPLTPPILSDSPMKKLKSVSFKKMIHEYIPELPSTFESGDAILSDGDSFAFYKQAAPVSEEVKRRVENEKLSEADATKRVDVPHVDFTPPIAPWAEFGEAKLDTQRGFLQRVKRQDLKSMSSWHGVSKLERELNWGVFPIHMAKVTIEEKLHGEDTVSKLLAELSLGQIATSSTDIWKRDGLRILEDDESEDELEVIEFDDTPHRTLDTSIKKRKMELEEEENDPSTRPRKEVSVAGSRPERQRRKEHPSDGRPGQAPQSKSPQRQWPSIEKEPDNSLMFGGVFSASTALSKFMETQGKSISSGPKKSYAHFPPPAAALATLPGLTTQTVQTDPPQHTSKTQEPVLPDLPAVPSHLPPCSFMISTTLLRQRTLTREVEKLYPDAQFIERDFSLPHSPAEEADMILSPSTGLIFTTLQQIKQRALPGQPDRSPIKERIVHLQARYERLTVLISEGLSSQAEEYGSGRPVDSRDQEAMAELGKFVSRMEAEVLYTFVQGGELALARTIVGEMTRWGLPHGSKDIGDLTLLQDETTWEVFLRRTGLNPFAAQIILASLRDPYDMELDPGSLERSGESSIVIRVSSLPAFIVMSPEERVQRFQTLLGGRRILSRVNAVLDRKWPSAANGFNL